MRLTVDEHARCYRIVFRFRRDKVSDECYSMCLPKAESPAELACILSDESNKVTREMMRHIRQRCEETVAIGYPEDANKGGVFDDD